MAQRLTYRRRHSYATRSNKTRKVKTPGALAAIIASDLSSRGNWRTGCWRSKSTSLVTAGIKGSPERKRQRHFLLPWTLCPVLALGVA